MGQLINVSLGQRESGLERGRMAWGSCLKASQANPQGERWLRRVQGAFALSTPLLIPM